MNEHVTRCTCLRKWDKINTASMQTSTFIKINQKVVEILELWIQHEWEWAVRTCRSVIASQGAASRAQGTTLQYWVKGTMQPYVPHICNFLQQKLPRGPHCNIESKAPCSHMYLISVIFGNTCCPGPKQNQAVFGDTAKLIGNVNSRPREGENQMKGVKQIHSLLF